MPSSITRKLGRLQKGGLPQKGSVGSGKTGQRAPVDGIADGTTDGTVDGTPQGIDDQGLKRRMFQQLDAWSAGKAKHADRPGSAAIKDAANSFIDPSIAPAQRRALLKQASGDPLTDAVLSVLEDFVGTAPAGAFLKGGAAVAKMVRDPGARDQVATKWYAMYLPSAEAVEHAGNNLEALRERVKDPGFRQELHRALDVVRAVGRLEAHHLEAIAIDVGSDQDPKQKAEVKKAFERYAFTSMDAVADALVPQTTDAGRAARDLIGLGVLHLRAMSGTATAEDGGRFRALVDGLGKGLGGLKNVQGAPTPAVALQQASDAARELPNKLDRARDTLLQELEGVGSLTPTARHAMMEVSEDMTAVTVTAAHLLRFVGAAQNTKIPEDERIHLLKHAAKDAGPVIVKLLQTFANKASVDGGGLDGVTMKALRQLQENVPEMSEAEVRQQVEDSLGMKLEDAFTHFDMKPLASASVGQVHRARLVMPNILGMGREVFALRAALREYDVAVKVQRPNLDVEFARATRVARLGVQLAGEIVSIMMEQPDGGPLKDLPKGLDPKKLLKLIEETVTTFVDSFSVETDFDKERENLKKFRRDSRSHAFVTAPYVFRRWSSRKVLTMEFMKLEKLPSLIERADLARAHKKVPTPATGPLDRENVDATRADVLRRALDHLPRAFGIRGIESETVLVREKAGWTVTCPTEHQMFSSVTLLVQDDGVIRHVKTPPIIKDRDVRALRDRFLASLLSQALVHGRVHGDPHKGNWGVMADGKTIVMLDFGKVISITKRHLMAPLQLAWSWYRGDAQGMANAVLSMSEGKVADREAARLELTDTLRELASQGTDNVSPEEILAHVTAALSNHGLGLASVYTHGIKAGFSFAGNFGGLADAGAGDITAGSLAGAATVALGDALDTTSLGVVGGIVAMRKNARARKLNA